MYVRLLLAVLLPLLSTQTAQGQQQQTSGWSAFTSTREMKDLLVHDGSVWSVSGGGVLRLDKETQIYSRYTRLDGLAGTKVLSLAADANGDIWFGTDRSGLSRFRTRTGTFDSPFLDFLDLQVNSLAADGNRLFVGFDRGVSHFLIDKEEVKETYRILGSLRKDTPVTRVAVFDNRLWAGTEIGLSWSDLSLPNLQDPDSWQTEAFLFPIHDILVFHDSLFVADRDGIHTFDAVGDTFRLDYRRNFIVSLGVLRDSLIAVTEGGSFHSRSRGSWGFDSTIPNTQDTQRLSRADTALWIATDDGLQVVGSDPPPPPEEPPANQFFDMALVGEQRELWVASVPNDRGETKEGVYQFDGENWTPHRSSNGLPSSLAVSPQGDRDGNVWVGTWGAGIGILDSSGTWQILDHQNSILEGIGNSKAFVAVSDITRDPAGLMWIAIVQVGLAVMDGYPAAQELLIEQSTLGLPAGRDIGKVAVGPNGLKWIATNRDGFILFDDGGTPFDGGDDVSLLIDQTVEPRLSSSWVRDIAVDENDRLWVATDNGLNSILGTYSHSAGTFSVPESGWKVYRGVLPSTDVRAVEADGRGNIWVGTANGLAQIGTTREVDFTLTTNNSGLINDTINSLLFDRTTGQLWIGTLDGLARLDVSSTPAKDVHVYPNPYCPDIHRHMIFDDLGLGPSVRIFTLDGNLLRSIEGEKEAHAVSWDGENAAGFLVASGIYFFVAENAAGKRFKGKFAVINGQR